MDRKITALKAQKRNPNRVNIYLDGEYAFGAARIIAAWLSVGQVLTEADITRLKQQDTHEVALQKAFRFISYKPRSESEVRKKLTTQGYEESVVDAVIDRLKQGGLIEDQGFARDWVENRSTFRPRSRRVLAMELRQKGVGEEDIQEALAGTQSDDELAYQVAIRRARRFGEMEWNQFRERMTGFLGRRGFAYGSISSAVRKAWDEMHSDESMNSMNENEVEA